jgi:single-stranded DNA-specific DHH superfamily exonuclease
MGMKHYDQYKIENSHADRALPNILKKEKTDIAMVHHNDADGLCSAASLIKRDCEQAFIDALENMLS